MPTYDEILKTRTAARAAWDRNTRMAALIRAAFDHLQFVIEETRRSGRFRTHPERERDFFAAVSAIVRCAVHYQFHCQDGCFGDARFYLRKVLEYIAVATAIGYDDAVYALWKTEEFTKPRKGFTPLTNLLLDSASVPELEKALLRVGIAREGKGDSWYTALSDASVHGLSAAGLRREIRADGGYDMDVAVLPRGELDEKMRTVCGLLFNSATLVLGATRYEEHVGRAGLTPAARRIKDEHERLQGLIVQEEGALKPAAAPKPRASAQPVPARTVPPAAAPAAPVRKKKTRRGKRGGKRHKKRAA